MQPRKRLGQLLTELGIVDELQIQSALGHQKQWGGKLGTILVQKGFCREEDVVRVLAQHLALPVVRLADVKVDPRAVKMVSRQVAEKLHVFAFEVSGAGRSEVVTVAMSDPTDLSSVDQLAFHTGKRIKPVLCGDSEIVTAVQQNYVGEATPAGQQQAPGQPAQQTGRSGLGGRPLPPLGPPPVMQPLRPVAGPPATPPARGQPALARAPGEPAPQQAAASGAVAPAPAAARPVPPVAASRASAPAGVGAAPQPVVPPRPPVLAPSAQPGIEGLESIAASAAGQSAVEGTEAFNDQGQTADAVEGIEPISDSTLQEGRSVAETDISVDGDFGEDPGDGPMEGLEPIAAHAQDTMEAGAGRAVAAEASAADWDAPPAAQPASPQAERGEQGATADVSWDEGPAAPEAIPAGHPDPGGWDVPAAAASESGHDAPAFAAPHAWSADGTEAEHPTAAADAGWAPAALASADEFPADELPADAILGTAEDVLEPAPHQEPEAAAPTGLPAWEDAPAPEGSPWDDAPVQEVAAPPPTQSPWADGSPQEVAAPEAAPSPWGDDSAQGAAAPEAAPSSWGAEPAQEAAAPEEAPSPWGDEPAQEAAAPPESPPEGAPVPDAEPGPGEFPGWAAEAPSHVDAALDAAPAPDAAAESAPAAAASEATAESAPDESESHAKTGKLFGFLAGSFNMAPPEEEASLDPGAAAAVRPDETQAGAESEPQAEAPDAWSDVADPLAAEAPAGPEAWTEAAASELASADAPAPAEPEGRESVPVEWAEDVALDHGSAAEAQSAPAAFANPPGHADGEESASVQAAEEHQAQPGFGEWSERAPSFEEAPPTDRITFGAPAAQPAADDAFAAEGNDASMESASDGLSLEDSAAGQAALAEPGVELSTGDDGAEGVRVPGEEPGPDEFAAAEPPTGELAADQFAADGFAGDGFAAEEPASEAPAAEEPAAGGPASWESAAEESAAEEPGHEPAPAPLGLEEYAVPGWVPPPPEPQPEGSGWLGQALASTHEPLSEAEEELLRAAGVEPSDGMGAMRLLAGLLRALQRRGVIEVSEVAADISAARSAGLDPPAAGESGAEPDADHPA